MKFFLVALSLFAVCRASLVALSPSLYGAPLAYSAYSTYGAPGLKLAYAAPGPLAYAAPAPLAYAAPAHLAYAAPAHLAYAAHASLPYVAPPVALAAPAPVIQPGYVAATRGSVHVAPLPGNTPYASHHLNLEPAPGTH